MNAKESFDKLPKWAQLEIIRLQKETSRLEQSLSAFNGEIESNVFISEGLIKRPLPINSQIEFLTGRDNMNKVAVYVRADGKIDVNTNSRIGQNMVVLPRAANSFYIKFID